MRNYSREPREFLLSTPQSTTNGQLRPAQIIQTHLTNYGSAMRGVWCEEDSDNLDILLLRGEVASYYEKQIAQEILRRAEGVIAFDNQVTVCEPEATDKKRRRTKGRQLSTASHNGRDHHDE